MDALTENNRILLPICLVLIASVCYAAFTTNSVERFWKTQDFAGLPDGVFPRFRGSLQAIKSMRAFVHSGYKRSLSTCRGFAVPVFGNDPVYVLPASEMRTLITKPDASLDAAPVQNNTIQVQYTIGRDMYNSHYHFGIIRRQLTRKLALFTGDIFEELALSFAAQWGKKPEWTSVNVYPTCMSIVSQAANRVFAGTSLCRNEVFLLAARNYTIAIFTSGAIINLVPKLLRPVLAPLIARPVRKQLQIVYREALPVIKDRIALYEKATRSGELEKIPSDCLTWLIEDSMSVDAKRKPNDPLEFEPTRICRRLLGMNMVAIHTTSIVSANLIMDIASSPDKDDMIAGLREEIDRVFKGHGNEWTKAAVDDLIRVDSAVRECLRYSPLGILGMHRLVVDPKGVDFGKVHVPPGVVVASPVVAINNDPNYFARPESFDPFRFSRPREEHLAKQSKASANSSDQEDGVVSKTGEANTTEDDAELLLELKRMSLVTTTDTSLGFGHGRHACPGRFFASQEMKLMLAYILTNYDIRMPGSGKRPQNMDFGHMSAPTDDAKVEIRWRGGS